MKTIQTIAVMVLMMLFAGVTSFAADTHATAPATPSHATTAQAAHPAANQAVLPPPDIRWPAVMMIIVLGMFLAAMVVGPVVRLNMPEEVPVSHTHDESHGHDRAHGGHGHDHGHGHGHGGHH